MLNKLHTLALAGTLVASSAGCGEGTETCRFTNPDKETAFSLTEAEDMCAKHRTSIIKCVVGDTDPHDVRVVTASCVDSDTAHYTLEKAYDEDNLTVCQTDAAVECTTTTGEDAKTEIR